MLVDLPEPSEEDRSIEFIGDTLHDYIHLQKEKGVVDIVGKVFSVKLDKNMDSSPR